MMRWTLVALRVVIGGIFLYAAYTKLSQPWLLFAMSIDAYQLLPQWGVLAVARTLPWFELLLGLVLVSGFLLRYAAAAASSLLAVFFGLMIHAYVKGMSIDCGCFGPGDALGPTSLLRDGTLLALAVVMTVLAFRVRRTVKAGVAEASSEMQPQT